MKIKVIGIENKNFKIEDYSFDGKYVYAAKIDEPRDGLIGNDIVTMKIQKTQPVFGVPLEVDKEYTVYYNDKKQVDFIAPITK